MDIVELVENGRIKRYFRARDKLSFEGSICHITQHATGKEPLFLEESDYLYLLHLMKDRSRVFKFRIFAFALMPNHIHLLVRFDRNNLSESMGNLFQRYAMYFNIKYKRRGHVFCGAFRSALCNSEDYILAASIYIHINPVRANLAKKAIDYRWSSCALYLKEVKKDTFVDFSFILEFLNQSLNKARENYRFLLGHVNFKEADNVIEQPKALESLSGALRKKLRLLYINEDDKKWAYEHGLFGDADIFEKIEELKSKNKLRGPQERAARKFLIEQLKARGFNISEISGKLGLSRKAVYTYLK